MLDPSVMALALRHWFAPHTGELELRVEAPSLPELYAEAGRGLADLMLGRAPPDRIDGRQRLIVRAPDREALLVEWLNELIFRSEVGRCVFSEIVVEHLEDTGLTASVGRATIEDLKTQPKAATLHRVSVREAPDGYSATVVIDV